MKPIKLPVSGGVQLRSRYDRLRERGMLTKQEAAARLNIHEHTVARRAAFGLIAKLVGFDRSDRPTICGTERRWHDGRSASR